MKATPIFSKKKVVRIWTILALICIAQIHPANAQMIRAYATRQAIKAAVAGSFSNETFAIDGNPATTSMLSQSLYLGLGSPYIEQILDFNPDAASTSSYATTIPANASITIKVNLPSLNLSVLNNMEIQAITGLYKSGGIWNYTNVGSVISGSNLLALLSGQGSNEIRITPNANFQGIRIRISPLTVLPNDAGVYHAYVMENAPASILCSDRIDLLSGVRPTTIAGLLSTTGTVTDPWNAIDNAINTYAQLNTGIDAMNEVHHTTIFNTVSKPGDSLKLLLQDMNGSLLNVGALTGFKIKFYNGTTLAQTITNDSSFLKLNLFDSAGNIIEVAVVPTVAFDKAEVMIGGTTNAFSGMNLYDVSRKNAGVILTNQEADVYVYAGQSYSLTATAVAAGDDVVFYDAATNGNIVSSGPNTTTLAQAGTIIDRYAGASRSGCTESSDRKVIHVNIIGFTRNLPAVAYLNTNYSSDIILSAEDTLPSTPAYQYATTSALPTGLSLDPNTGIITGMPTSSGPFAPIVVTITDVSNNLAVGTFDYPFTVLLDATLGFDMELKCVAGNKEIMLNWNAYSEANKSFIIERSTDAIKFAAIGVVESDYNSESNKGKILYKFTDKLPHQGINYYRIQQMDLNNETYYSNVVAAMIHTENPIHIFPNPVKGMLNIQTGKVKETLIYNSMGQLVAAPLSFNDNNHFSIDTGSLTDGFYSLRIVTENDTIIRNIIVKH